MAPATTVPTTTLVSSRQLPCSRRSASKGKDRKRSTR